MTRASELFGGGSINFSDPDDLIRAELDAAATSVYDSTSTRRILDTTISFTSLNTQGLADTTNWATDTFKSLLSVSEPGELVGYIGPVVATAGQIHTIEITLDGVVSTIPITATANTKRPALFAMAPHVNTALSGASEAFAAHNSISTDKRSLLYSATQVISIPTWPLAGLLRPPLLAWKNSLVIRAKNSVGIANAVSTAYSAIIYRLKGGTS
jgi:hypothetical protein